MKFNPKDIEQPNPLTPDDEEVLRKTTDETEWNAVEGSLREDPHTQMVQVFRAGVWQDLMTVVAFQNYLSRNTP